VQRLANILAFERRCIRSSFVAQVCRTLPRYAFTCAPCWRGASTLSMRQAICETLHCGTVDYSGGLAPVSREADSSGGASVGASGSTAAGSGNGTSVRTTTVLHTLSCSPCLRGSKPAHRYPM